MLADTAPVLLCWACFSLWSLAVTVSHGDGLWFLFSAQSSSVTSFPPSSPLPRPGVTVESRCSVFPRLFIDPSSLLPSVLSVCEPNSAKLKQRRLGEDFHLMFSHPIKKWCEPQTCVWNPESKLSGFWRDHSGSWRGSSREAFRLHFRLRNTAIGSPGELEHVDERGSCCLLHLHSLPNETSLSDAVRHISLWWALNHRSQLIGGRGSPQTSPEAAESC